MLTTKQIKELPKGNFTNWELMKKFPYQQGRGRSLNTNPKRKNQNQMKMKQLKLIILMICLALIFGGCADNQSIAQTCLQGHQYGFWGGLWHGVVMPFSFIGQLFSDDIAVWAPNNNGGWYTFGFVLGAGGLSWVVGKRR